MLDHDPPPAIVMITVDDCGNEFFGCYGEGPPERQPRTDNIDALAARGLRFDNFYANPICTPTRACMLTGRYASRYNLGAAIEDGRMEFLPGREVCFPELLADTWCGHVGKWHLGSHFEALDPMVQGFRVRAGAALGVNDYFSFDYAVAWKWAQVWTHQTTYLTTQTTDDALAVLALAPRPMVLWVAYNAPHDPFHDPPGYSTDGSDIAQYMAMIEYLDQDIGRLLSALDLDHDFVILSADNGSPRSVASTSGHKSQVLEGGINVPLIVAGPGVSVGSTGSLASAVDLHTTVVEISGGSSSAADGRSLVPILRNPGAEVRDHVYVERFDDRDGDGFCELDLRAARDSRYKLIWDLDDEAFYNLDRAPPGEDGLPLDLDNLTNEQRAAYERLHAIVLARGR